MKNVSEEFARLMAEEGFSQADFARQAGCTRPNVSQAVNPKYNWSIEKLKAWLSIIGYDMEIRFVRRTKD